MHKIALFLVTCALLGCTSNPPNAVHAPQVKAAPPSKTNAVSQGKQEALSRLRQQLAQKKFRGGKLKTTKSPTEYFCAGNQWMLIIGYARCLCIINKGIKLSYIWYRCNSIIQHLHNLKHHNFLIIRFVIEIWNELFDTVHLIPSSSSVMILKLILLSSQNSTAAFHFA